MWFSPFLAVPAQVAVICQLDDGTRVNSAGLSGGGDLAWANRFLTLPGGTSITAVSPGNRMVRAESGSICQVPGPVTFAACDTVLLGVRLLRRRR